MKQCSLKPNETEILNLINNSVLTAEHRFKALTKFVYNFGPFFMNESEHIKPKGYVVLLKTQ